MPLACSFACDHDEGKVDLRFVSIASRAVLVWHNAGYQTPPPSAVSWQDLAPCAHHDPACIFTGYTSQPCRSMRLETHDKSCRGNARAMQSLFVARTYEAMRTGLGGRVRRTPKRSGLSWPLLQVRNVGASLLLRAARLFRLILVWPRVSRRLLQ